MINYGPELQDIVFGHEDYTCTNVKMNGMDVELKFVPKGTKLEVVNFVWASWYEAMDYADTLDATSTSVTLEGDWPDDIRDDFLCDLEDLYEFTRESARRIVLTYKGAVFCTLDSLTREKMKAHLLNACCQCTTVGHWRETLTHTLHQTLANVACGVTDIDDEAQAKIMQTLAEEYGRTFWISNASLINTTMLKLARSL